jgi:RNase H-like domain found in reverse transcriptase
MQSDTGSLDPKSPKTSQFSVIRRFIEIESPASESYYHSYTVSTSGVNRLAGQICHNRLFRKKLQHNSLPMISTEVPSLAAHKNGVLHPIGYWSRQLSPTERLYHITEKEFYAVYWAAKLLRPYLEGSRLTVRADHGALTWLFNADGNSTPRLTLWRLGLAQFDFIVKYRPGVQHQPADGVSRLVTLGHDSSAVEDEIPCCVVADDASKESVPTPGPTLEDTVLDPITLHELIDAQSQDPFCLSKLGVFFGWSYHEASLRCE